MPKSLDQIDAGFMTKVLRHNGVISSSNEVVAQGEEGVGMTAGYFSAIKKVRCRYKEATDAPRSFVVKTWPPFEILPKENIRAMFVKDIAGYQFAASEFYPHPKAYLAAADLSNDCFALVMEDADNRP